MSSDRKIRKAEDMKPKYIKVYQVASYTSKIHAKGSGYSEEGGQKPSYHKNQSYSLDSDNFTIPESKNQNKMSV